MTEKLNILIVDDEVHARKLMTEYATKLPFLELKGACHNAIAAIDILQREKIDILLLDISMPEITGMELARSLKKSPSIIFTTAYSEYAVESYELDVVDYLLKPISFTRFLQAINKVVEKRESIQPQPTAVDLTNRDPEQESIIIKSGYKVYKIDLNDLLYLEAMGEYISLYTVKQKITIFSRMKDMEAKLPVNQFIRIHKSYIVSLKHIDYIEKECLHIAGKAIHMGRVYKDNVMRYFDKK